MLFTDKQTDKQTDRQTNQRYQKHNLLSQGGNNAKVGCTMNEVIINHLMYADDLVLIAPSIRAMQTLLNSCRQLCT